MNNLDRLIGISGVATVGKDTFYKLFKKRMFELYGSDVQRFALADELKNEIRDFCIKDYGIDILNCNAAEKEIIRPYLVFYGNFKRFQSNGSLWWEKIKEKLLAQVNDFFMHTVITDIRYCQYEKDDLYFIKSNDGFLIHIKRVEKDGFSIVKPANPNEQKYDPLMESNADYKVVWPTSSNESELIKYVDEAVDSYIDFLEKD